MHFYRKCWFDPFEKTNVDQGKAKVDIFFSWGDNFPCYPLVQSIIIILYWMLIENVWFQNNLGQVNVWVCIRTRKFKRSYKISQNLWWTFLRSLYFSEYHPSSSNITRCQVPSCVRAWFHNSAESWWTTDDQAPWP